MANPNPAIKRTAKKRDSSDLDKKIRTTTSPQVKPVVNALRILRHLNAVGYPDSVTNIARALGINTSTCFNILRTLASERIVDFNDKSKSYTIGLGIAQLAQTALSDGGKIEVFRPVIEKIAEAHSVTVTLWRLTDRERNVLISAARSSAAFQIQMPIGQRLPLFIGALGRALAFYRKVTKNELRTHFAKMRWDNPPVFEQYWRDVQDVGKRGWAIDQGNFAKGITSLGVPVFDSSGSIRHGMVATTFQGQLGPKELAKLGKAMLDITQDIHGFF
jgi:DNA-binding IclR family transcriptional regulator